MTPIYQDKFNNTFPYGGGNCLQACIASLLDKPLEAVPHFMLFGKEWYTALSIYLDSVDYKLEGWWEGEPPHDGEYYMVSMDSGDVEYGHACIYKNGKVVHDPHPFAKEPLTHCSHYYRIKKLAI